ncbi:Lipase-GDSL domain-containing protein [Mycena kentingensis (nom. inval.)]|nr:Lipase-GDSL domain-containing protein [Mycena kentingensis (nom. inval.)]
MSAEPQPEFPSKVLQKTPTWRGLDSLKFLVIFGDSYSAVGYDFSSSTPTAEDPLGVEFPGDTYTEGGPNWVGHLVRTFAPKNDWRVYDYAVGGARAGYWTAEDSLFVTWVGINDSAWGPEAAETVEKLFTLQDTVHAYGARNFLFINIPPIDRSPARGQRQRYIDWNTELEKAVASFAAKHPECTVLLFSSWDVFNSFLDDPEVYGFVHEYIANGVVELLSSQ